MVSKATRRWRRSMRPPKGCKTSASGRRNPRKTLPRVSSGPDGGRGASVGACTIGCLEQLRRAVRCVPQQQREAVTLRSSVICRSVQYTLSSDCSLPNVSSVAAGIHAKPQQGMLCIPAPSAGACIVHICPSCMRSAYPLCMSVRSACLLCMSTRSTRSACLLCMSMRSAYPQRVSAIQRVPQRVRAAQCALSSVRAAQCALGECMQLSVFPQQGHASSV